MRLLQRDLTILSELQAERYEQIDIVTGKLISEGYVYNGVTFSMSVNAQSNLLGAYTAKDLLTYPFAWNAKDDSSTYYIADAAEMTTFFMTSLGTKKAHQDSGTALKQLIRDAVDIEAVNAIIDNR